jgi:hypothetical protein
MNLEKLAKKRLNGHSKCAGHCQQQSVLKFLHQKGITMGCNTCPSGYVSLIVHYGKELDLHAFKTFLSSIQPDVTDEDIRVATRYKWDLGIKGERDGKVLREAYWRQNYRRTKSDDPRRIALFLCSKCGSFYSRQISNPRR